MVPNVSQQRRRRAPGVGDDGCVPPSASTSTRPSDGDDWRYYDSDGGAAKSRYRKSDPRSVGRERRKRAYLVTSVVLLTAALVLLVTTGDDYGDETTRGFRARRAEERKERRRRRMADEARERARERGYGAGPGDDERAAEYEVGDDGGKRKGAPNRSPSGRYRWTDPRVLPQMPDGTENTHPKVLNLDDETLQRIARNKKVFKAHRPEDPPMSWEIEQDEAESRAASAAGETNSERMGPKVDYTKWEYTYPDVKEMAHPPTNGSYPPLETLGTLMKRWPQDDIDDPPKPFPEALVNFDFQNPEEMESALRYREAELPFKVHNVPELIEAGERWTDEYVSAHFDKDKRGVLKRLYASLIKGGGGGGGANGRGNEAAGDERERERALTEAAHIPRSNGHAQESADSFFAFFQPHHWDVSTMGRPPTKDNDFTYARWAKHARYADRVGLAPQERHYYWQSGVPREERLSDRATWTFVSRDLPSFSDPRPTFFGFNPPEQKGIQCRFGERGVTAATHYDAGRNMVAMITGAKRYVLGPPRECSKLGIETTKRHPTFRHSLLNFAHLNLLDEEGEDARSMPPEEREWLEVARDSEALETVLKAGEVLYIPSHWFHYITSLQKSAQCNTRSGREKEGTKWFGGYEDVVQCVGEGA